MDLDHYPLWADETAYHSSLVVAQHHPAADDANAGNAEAPLKTIQAAWQRVQPGQRIRVHAGVYRELLCPQRGGSGPQGMIALENAPGEQVVVRGSRILSGSWSRPKVFDEAFIATGRTPSMSQKVWVIRPGETLSTADNSDSQPWQLPNVQPYEEPLMPWMEPVLGRPPFTLRRAMLFQDGQRLTQLHHHGDVPRVPGSFWVDDDGASLLVHPLGGIHPDQVRFELAVQPHLLCPQDIGLDYIALRGITFEHCANSFLRASAGAVTTRGGGHWIIEDCSFRDINSAGLEFGDHPFENKDPHPQNPARGWRGSGHVIVRRNIFRACGTAGIRCLGTSEARVLNNDISDCGWQGAEYYYECAGIKLLLTRHCLVAHNRISRLTDACGIWLDWDNRGSRVSGNVITDIDALQGGIFIEASLEPNRIDHNVIWRIDGTGIFGGDSSRQIYEHNLIGATQGVAMSLYCHTDRQVNKQPVACVENSVRNNLFVDVPGHRCDADNNTFRENTYIHSLDPLREPWPSWQARGIESEARHLRGQVSYDPQHHRLRLNLDQGAAIGKAGPIPLPDPQGVYDLGIETVDQ